MDTPTQALLGATLGQAFFGRKLGSRAAIGGAVAGALPDLDILAVGLMGPWAEFLYHRGPTHALWFGPVVGAALGYGVWRAYASAFRRKARAEAAGAGAGGGEPEAPARMHPGSPEALRPWVGLFVLALITHPLLDLFTSYGTQLFSPFWNRRFAIHAIAILDPFYSFLLAAGLAAGLVRGARSRFASRAALVAVALSTAYVLYGGWLGARAESEVRRQLAREGIYDTRVRCYPTLFQVYLRRVVARTPDEVRVGLLSMWAPSRVRWERFPVSEGPLVDRVRDTEHGRMFEWFALGETLPRVAMRDGVAVVEITDLRYGFPRGASTGIWGIRAVFDPEGRQVGEVRRFNRGLPPGRQVFFDIWRGAFGAGA